MSRAAIPRRLAFAAGALLALASCDNAGADRSTGVVATGVVRGTVRFDANGSGTADAADVPVAGARLRLVTPVSRDTVMRATTGVDGSFRVAGVPVGDYAVVLDGASGGDSVSLATVDLPAIRVLPQDSVELTGLFGFAERTALAVRALAPGSFAFVEGVALHATGAFSDTLFHVEDASGAIRAARIRPGSALANAGDSVRVRGRVAMRLGQPVLDEVTVFIVAPTFTPAADPVTTAQAAAAGAARDAQLVRLTDVLVSDTATVLGHLRMTVSDGSGPVVVVLDRQADAAFRPPLPAGVYQAGNRFDIVGVLVPTGTGTWVVRPRSSLDVTLR